MAARKKPAGQNKAERDLMRAAGLMRRLIDYGMATPVDEESTVEERDAWKKTKMEPGQVTAVTTALKKLVPDLQAQEMTVIDERDALTEEEIHEKLKQLIKASPALVMELLGQVAPVAIQEKVNG
jgi:hypothetical protein